MLVYLMLKWIHLIAASLVLGLLAAFPFLPTSLAREPAPQDTLRYALRFLRVCSHWLLVPSIVVLFITGFLMSIGPFSEWNMLGRDGQWIVIGMFLWTLVAGIVAGLMLGLVKEMTTLAERGETSGERMRRLWKQFRWGYVAAVVVTLITFVDMVFQPVVF